MRPSEVPSSRPPADHVGVASTIPTRATTTATAHGEPLAFDERVQVAQSAPRAHDLDLDASSIDARYERGGLLGAGGMGEVHLHRDRRIGRRVAMKTLRIADDEVARDRFLREARVQGQLEHPAIVPVYDPSSRNGSACSATPTRSRPGAS